VGAALVLGCVLPGCGSGIDSPEPLERPTPPAMNNAPAPAPLNTPPVSQPVTEAPPMPVRPPMMMNQAPVEAPWQAPASVDPNSPVGKHGQLRVLGNALVDQSGAPLQLKGISTMWLNWEDRYSTSKEALQWMRDNWGVTIFRAAMGVEPQGAYLSNPDKMLSQLRRVVHNAIDLGVYVLIDWHDHHAFEHQSQSVEFFSKIADEFGRFPHVLYETFNEPEQADWASQIKPYHTAAVSAIRAKDPDGIVILGSRQWSQRPDEAIMDRVQGDNLMYTVHFYACDHREQQREEAQRAYDAGLAIFVTEWGATPADGGDANPTVCADEATAWHDWMDERNIGWAAWKLDGCDDSSCLFNSKDAPINGNWTDQWLNGHAQFVVERLKRQ
jgi:aryl-phospho-beta-D-glucosidase BglC (GH1 family)